jgi:hypothetical protein
MARRSMSGLITLTSWLKSDSNCTSVKVPIDADEAHTPEMTGM